MSREKSPKHFTSDRHKIAQIMVLEHLDNQRAGGSDSDDVFLAKHPKLREELQTELQKARVLKGAFLAADSNESDSPAVLKGSNPPGASNSDSVLTLENSICCPSCRTPIAQSTIARLEDDTAKSVCNHCGEEFIVRKDVDVDQVAHFDLIERLGSGGFGTVWRALDTKLDREVAVKISQRRHVSGNAAAEFLREARAAAQLQHPNIVATFEVGQDGPITFIATQLVEGPTLKERLDGRAMSAASAAELCATIALAADYAHNEGVIHRDLKPQNVLIDYDGQPHIADFGLARFDDQQVTVTMDGQIIGTPAYMPPEQAQGDGQSADRRSDVYAIGVMLFEMLTGELPFRGTLPALMRQVVSAEPPRLRVLQPRVPRDLETICLKCLEKRPDARYQSAKSLAEDLIRWKDKQPIVARPLGRIGRLWRWCERKPAVAGLATLVAVVTLVGVAGIAWQWRRAVDANRDATRQKELAIQNRDDAWRTIDSFLDDVSDAGMLDQPQFGRIQANMLALANQQFERLRQQDDGTREMKLESASALQRLGALKSRFGQFMAGQENFSAAFQLLDTVTAAADKFDYDLACQRAGLLIEQAASLSVERHQVPLGGNNAAVADNLAAAQEILSSAIDYRPSNPRAVRLRAEASSLIATYYAATFDPRAMQHLYSAVEDWQQLLTIDPENPEALLGLATCYRGISKNLSMQGQLAEPVVNGTEAVRLCERFVAKFPDSAKGQSALASALTEMGKIYFSVEDFANASPWYHKALKLQKRLSRDYPTRLGQQVNLCTVISDLSIVDAYLGKHEQSIKLLDDHAGFIDGLLQEHPENDAITKAAILAKLARAEVNFRIENFEETELLLNEIIAELSVEESLNDTERQILQRAYARRGSSQSMRGLSAEAEESLLLANQFGKVEKDHPKYFALADSNLVSLVRLCQENNKRELYQKSLKFGRQAVEQAHKLVDSAPERFESVYGLGVAQVSLGQSLMDSGQLPEAQPLVFDGLENIERGIRLAPPAKQIELNRGRWDGARIAADFYARNGKLQEIGALMKSKLGGRSCAWAIWPEPPNCWIIAYWSARKAIRLLRR